MTIITRSDAERKRQKIIDISSRIVRLMDDSSNADCYGQSC